MEVMELDTLISMVFCYFVTFVGGVLIIYSVDSPKVVDVLVFGLINSAIFGTIMSIGVIFFKAFVIV